MLHGAVPSERHDSADWKPSDEGRSILAGAAVGYNAIVLQTKGVDGIR